MTSGSKSNVLLCALCVFPFAHFALKILLNATDAKFSAKYAERSNLIHTPLLHKSSSAVWLGLRNGVMLQQTDEGGVADMSGIPEKDWKYLSSLRAGLIDRYCGKTLAKIRSILASGKSGDNLEQLQKIFQLIEKRDKPLLRDLSDFRRSNAILKILAIRKLGFFSEEEFDGFSDEVKSIIKKYEEW